MRALPNNRIESHRVPHPADPDMQCRGTNSGAFRFKRSGITLYVIASDHPDSGWEHVSVHVIGERRCPTWEEMCWVKDQFWRDDECVVQYHPAKASYVNTHATTLHLWCPTGTAIPTPPTWMV